jgi:dTDP-4-dehydrorhamnose 3,5-epimerase
MIFLKLNIEGLTLINHDLFEDDRGMFRRSFCKKEMEKNGIKFTVKQGNISENLNAHTMRGFHYQKGSNNEAKILSCLTGAIYNVVVDLRKNSETYLKNCAIELNSEKRDSLLVPGGCANAFLTLGDDTIVHYYMNDYFKPETYSGFRYNDPFFSIKWPFEPKNISKKDLNFLDYQDEKM